MAAGNSNNNGEKGRFSVTLSGKGLTAVIALFIIGLAWTFVLGVLLGRGYNPEEAVPELARLMPEASENASKTTGDEGPGVLKPEELEFFDELQKKPEEVVEAAETAPEAAPKKAVKSAPAESPPAGKPGMAERAEDESLYMYIFQAAAFKNREQAKNFRARIEALGYSAGVETATYGGDTWHRVLVHFKGTPDDAGSLKEALRGLGVEKPLLRGKKPL